METAAEMPVGVVGAGTMGAGIAQVALEAGHAVRLYDPDPAALDRAWSRIEDGLNRRAAKRAASGEPPPPVAAADLLRGLSVASSVEELAAGAGLIVEAVLEDLALKVRLFHALDAAASPDAILATNTSALSVSAIGAGARHPGRVIGLHFFNPAPVMRLVEVVQPSIAEGPVLDRAMRLMTAWGKTPVRCTDAPGFIVNRVNRPYTLEALRMLEAGLADVERLDAAARSNGYPMGPFELMDLIGLDINLAAANGLFQAFGREPRFRPSPIQERFVAAGSLGRKTGLGFYRYHADGRAIGVSLDIAAGRPPSQPGQAERPAEELVERLTLGVVNEAYHALGEEVATPADIDLALRLGAGHPLGPFERVAALGGPRIAAKRLTRLADAYGERFRPAPALRDAAAAG